MKRCPRGRWNRPRGDAVPGYEVMNSGTIAGPRPRTDPEAPTLEKDRADARCDVCGEREAEGVMPDGRAACEPCARREPVMDTGPNPVDPDVGDLVLFESQGMEIVGRVVEAGESTLQVERRVPEDIVVEQVVEIVEEAGDL